MFNGITVGLQYLASDPVRDEAATKLAFSVPPTWGLWHHGSQERESIRVWSARLWEGTREMAYLRGDSHVLFLQEDVQLAPGFWQTVTDMVTARPDDIICLHSPHWKFQDIYDAGADWATTDDGLVGNAYIMPRHTMREILWFAEHDVRPDAMAVHSEDGLIGTYTLATRRKVFHPLPSPIDHLHLSTSLYDHDEDMYYRPVVRTATRVPNWHSAPVDLGLVYHAEHWRARQYLTKMALIQYSYIERAYELERLSKNPRTRP